MLYKVPAFFVPEVAPDVGVDRLARLVPACERRRQRAFGGQADRTVQGHPAHQSGMQKVVLLTAHFPDAHIFLVPDFADLIGDFHGVFPTLVGDGFAVLVDQVHRVHQLAINIQLDLVDGLIADAHRPGATVAAEVVQLGFWQLLTTVDAVEDVDFGRLAAAVADASFEPTHVSIGFVDEAQAHKGIDGKRGVTDPSVTVVPVALAAGCFRQPEGGGGDNCAVFARGQQLQRQGRAVDHFAPAPTVVRLGDPATPELQRVGQRQVGTAAVDAFIVLAAEDKFGAFFLSQGKARHGSVVFELQWMAAGQTQARLAVGAEAHGAVIEGGGGWRACVVMAHGAAQVDVGLAADHAYPADQQRQVIGFFADGQQVRDFHHGFIAEPAGLQHVGVGQVDLLAAGVGQIRGELEDTGIGGVEQRAKDRGAVEFRPAEKIDAAFIVNQRRAAHVADDAVGVNGALWFVFQINLFQINHCHETPDIGSCRRQ